MSTLLYILSGFFLGLIFSKGRENPLGDAVSYAERGVRTTFAMARSLLRKMQNNQNTDEKNPSESGK